MKKLKISKNRRYLVTEDGSPFFWLGDTAWNLVHKLNREEIEEYIMVRAVQEFNVIQVSLLSEDDGIKKPNRYQRYPLLKDAEGNYNVTVPDEKSGENGYSYWDHVDYMIDLAAEYGIYVGLLPCWGDKFNITQGIGPEVLNETNAGQYGRWLARRYHNKNNIIWILGGDRSLVTQAHYNTIIRLAEAIKEVGKGTQLITFHPVGPGSSVDLVYLEKWLDFNMIQSGHFAGHASNYEMIQAGYEKQPFKPVLDAEPRYEAHPIGFCADNGYFDEWDIRQAAYWSVLSGAFGHTYGHHGVWRMNEQPDAYFPVVWRKALQAPGAGQMKYLRRLLETTGYEWGKPCQEILYDNYGGANYLAAYESRDAWLIYTPNGLPIRVVSQYFTHNPMCYCWYNPRNGQYTRDYSLEQPEPLGQPAQPEDGFIFMPPGAGRNYDWVLLIKKPELI